MGPAGKLCGAEPSAECPWRSHRFPLQPDVFCESRAAKATFDVGATLGKPAVDGPVDVVACLDRGALQPIAAKVLMKILYAA